MWVRGMKEHQEGEKEKEEVWEQEEMAPGVDQTHPCQI